MPPKPRNGLLAQLADLDDPVPRDFDPEDEQPAHPEDEGTSDDDADTGSAAREHYQATGKSRLRRPEQPSLGPQYAGSKVARHEALEEEEHDPFAKQVADYGDSFGSDDSLHSSADAESGSNTDHDGAFSDDSEEQNEGDQQDGDSDATAMSEMSEADKAEASSQGRKHGPATETSMSSIRELMAQDQKLVASSLSRAAREDIEKGRAVKRQRTAFDGLLNTRIKLQRSLIGANTLSALVRDNVSAEGEDREILADVCQNAEKAAFTLWSSLASLREVLQDERAGSKRTHAQFAGHDSTSALWSHTVHQDAASRSFVDSTLEKWYKKTHVTEAVAASRSKLNKTTPTSSVHDILSSTLSDSSRLLKRARTPRSCAPYQLEVSARKKPRAARQDDETNGDESEMRRDTGDLTVYDDADFYSVLLTTLLEQRASASSLANLPNDIGSASGYQIRREAKTKKIVDTKASKGRKLRYTVHEKLANLMAPEDRTTWGERQIDELFSSLLGRRVRLDESESEGEDVDERDKSLLFGR